MKRIRTPWLALVALAAASCRTEPATDPAAAPPKAQSMAATPIVPAAKPAEPVAAVKAVPIVPGAGAAPGSAAPASNSDARSERMKAVQSEYEAAMDAFYEPFRQAKTDEERQKLAETTKPPDAAPYYARARAIVNEDPADAAAFAALSFLVSQRGEKEAVARDIGLLERHHFESAQMLELLMQLQYSDSPAGKALLARLAKESPHREVRGRALMAQAEALKDELSTSAQIAALTDDKERGEYVGYFGQEEFDRLLALDRARVEADVLALYETVVREYADVPAMRSGAIGDQARAAIHELRNLVVGKVAPDIAGEDVQGVAFHLSDYRGKVVLLDFWGNW